MNNCLIQTPLFGNAEGTPFDDLTSNQWPAVLALGKISMVEVTHGDIVDNMTIKYSGIENEHIHGKHRGAKVDKIDLEEKEFLIGVYGMSIKASEFGATSIAQLQFVILNKETGKVSIKGPFGRGRAGAAATPFYVTNNIVGFAGYTSKNDQYLQSLSLWTNFVQ